MLGEVIGKGSGKIIGPRGLRSTGQHINGGSGHRSRGVAPVDQFQLTVYRKETAMNSKLFTAGFASLGILLGIVIVTGFGFNAQGRNETKETNNDGEKQTAERVTRSAANFTVRIHNYKFDPEIVEIEEGDTVTWINEDEIAHNACRYANPSFCTQILQKSSESEAVQFNQASDGNGFEYFCEPHNSTMKGRVVVKAKGSYVGHVGHEEKGRNRRGERNTKLLAERGQITVTVRIHNYKYDPETVEIQVGDSVEWINDDEAQHSANHLAKPSFSTGLLSKGQSKTITFQEASAGNGLEYFCGPHPWMKGRVVVRLGGSYLAKVGHAVKNKSASREKGRDSAASGL
jgi:plastocyanin